MKIEKLFVDQAVSGHSETASFLEKQRIPVEYIAGAQELYRRISRSADPIQAGKRVLFLTANKGPFLKQCPGTSHYTCCDYFILHIGSFCTMDCSYCILQTYFHPPLLQYFINTDKLFQELDHLFSSRTLKRVGTGEFTDSLIWEPCTDITERLVTAFAGQRSSILELKTKTVAIDSLLNLAHNRKTILAWSLNTESVIRSEERGTASLSARLKAASTAARHGYPVAFHFDPLILYEGCEGEYRSVIERIFQHVAPQDIVWISMGSFRFIPSLKPIIQERFPKSKIVYGEFIPGIDGKMRYFKPMRIRLYHQLVSMIRDFSREVMVYLCMEDDEVWQKTFGFTPAGHACGSLPRMLDQSAADHCGLHGFHHAS